MKERTTIMQFIKTRNVKSPVRDVNENAGIDFYIPENTEDFREALLAKNKETFDIIDQAYLEQSRSSKDDLVACFRNECHRSYLDAFTGEIYIAPHKAIIIPTGIMSKFEPNLALIANNKSGIATKKQLIFGASVIDASYQGEWHINLINTSDKYQELSCGQKAVQFIPHVISMDPVEIVDKTPKEFYTEKTSRGAGWAGSTGLK